MTNKETVNRNIGLSFDFVKQIVNSPKILEDIDNESVIEFIQKDYPELENKKNITPDKFIKVKRKFELI
jgi:hypothetical protein